VGQLDPSPAWEVLIPNKRAESLTQRYGLKTSGDDRFVYVYNFTPSTSVTVVDTQTKRRRHGIAIPGCVLNYPVGKRRFASLCGDGSLQVVTLNDQARNRAQPHAFFDPNAEKLVERGQRRRHLLLHHHDRHRARSGFLRRYTQDPAELVAGHRGREEGRLGAGRLAVDGGRAEAEPFVRADMTRTNR
jgi:hypothetical protein